MRVRYFLEFYRCNGLHVAVVIIISNSVKSKGGGYVNIVGSLETVVVVDNISY